MKINLKEDLVNEFKSDRARLPDSAIIDAVVAFANTEGGTLYLGVEDSGEITGLHPSHMDITQLSAFISNNTVPPVSVRAEIIDLGAPVLKIEVPKKTAVVSTASGKIGRRRIKVDGTPENIPMYPYEIATRLSSLGLFDYTAQPVPGACYSDLDPVERGRLRNIIRSQRGEVPLLELNDEELDKALQLIVMQDGVPVPTYCGLLLIGKKEKLKQYMPTAESAVQVLSGTEVRVNESFYLPILAAFEKISDCFNAQNREREIEIGLFRLAVPDYDPRAFREALVNAFSHRDYSSLGRVRVQISDEGLTISNPGGFIEGISANNLIEAEPHGRNPVLADALKRIGLAERTGRGIDRIFEGSLLYGRLLPDYSQSSGTGVSLFIPKGPFDEAFVKMISSERRRTGRSLPIHPLMVMNSLRKLHKASVQSIAEDINTNETRVRAALEMLTKSGLAELAEDGRAEYYTLGADYGRYGGEFSKAGNSNAGYENQDERVLRLAEKQGFVKRSDVAELLCISKSQAYRTLSRMVGEHKLAPVGKGAGSQYVPLRLSNKA